MYLKKIFTCYLLIIIPFFGLALEANAFTNLDDPIKNDEIYDLNSSDKYMQEDEEENNVTYQSIAVLETNYGNIKFGLYEELAPITTENFIKLADEKFYDGIKFHRIIDDFVIQTGDPNTRDNNPYNDGMGGSADTIPLEIHPELTHIDGAVGMARSSDPDSASSQFYICDGPQHGLDGDYAVFGVTIEGIEVVREIAMAETYPEYRVALKDHPIDDIVMFQVYIIEPEIIENISTLEPAGSLEDENRGLQGFEIPLVIVAVAAVAVLAIVYRRKKRR